MSPHRIARVLSRLASANAVLRLNGAGPDYGVFSHSDRRCRAHLRIGAAEVRALEAEGVIERRGADAFGLTAAGRARVAREAAEAGEEFVAQHTAVVTRNVVDVEGVLKKVRGFDPDGPMRRLAALCGPKGEPWLSQAELSAAGKLRADFAVSGIGLVRGSDWTAAPMGSSARSGANAQEAAMARRCDARRRVAVALARLAPPLRRVVERVCLHDEGLEALERGEGWPARSGKLALKLGLAQLAAEL